MRRKWSASCRQSEVFVSHGPRDGPGYLPAGRADRAARLDLGRTSSPLGLCRPSARTDSTTSEKKL